MLRYGQNLEGFTTEQQAAFSDSAHVQNFRYSYLE